MQLNYICLAYNDLHFVLGAMILNRVVSAINAVRLVSAYNNRNEEELSWNVSIGLKQTANLPTSLNLNFQTTFVDYIKLYLAH